MKTKRQIDAWSVADIEYACPLCGAAAVVKLTPRLLKLQTDGTAHVCHPWLGGCNHGFEDLAQKKHRWIWIKERK